MKVHTERRPNFFIVGAQKSGTSAMSSWIGQHPQVLMSFPKEPGFLAFENGGYPYKDGYGRIAPASQYVVDKEADYLGLFAGAQESHSILGESSTWYFSLPGMASRIKAFSPEARILVILRNPVDRAYSAWSHARRDALEPCASFKEALDQEAERSEVEFLLRYHYMGMYSKALSDYQATFDSSRLMVLFYEELRGNQSLLWQRLCSFLGIDPTYAPPPQRRLNRSGNPRIRILHNALSSYRTRVIARKILPLRVSAWAKENLDKLNLRKPEGPEQDTRLYLQQYYRQDIEELESLTGRNFASWFD